MFNYEKIKINNNSDLNNHNANNINYYHEFNIIQKNNSDLSQDKKISELKEKLDKSQETITRLNNKIKELEDALQSKDSLYLNKIQSLQNAINQRDEELNRLKERLLNSNINNNRNQNNLKIIKGGNKCVTFISSDQKITYGIPCSGDDIFAEIEEILYKEYPEYRETNNVFLANGKEILRFKSINDNKIGTGRPIILIKPS